MTEQIEHRITRLCRGARGGDREAILEAIRAGVDLNAGYPGGDQWPWATEGETALHLAIQGGHDALVTLLLDSGADVNATGGVGICPLNYAIGCDRRDIAEILLAHGAHVDGAGGSVPLCRAATVIRTYPPGANRPAEEANDLILFLLERGARVNARDKTGSTPLMGAAAMGCRKAIGVLLSNGADVSLRNASGFTAMGLAQRMRQTEIVNLLAAAGATE